MTDFRRSRKIVFICMLTIDMFTNIFCLSESCASPTTQKIYCAGRLSSISSLIFNRHLADKISEVSNKRYECVLPQEEVMLHKDYSKIAKAKSKHEKRNIIKNVDIELVTDAKAIIVNMDGRASSVGSITEFMIAKCMNKPAILYKTDVGHDSFDGKKHDAESGPWSVMLNYFPTTKIVLIPSGKLFRKFNDIKNTTKLSDYLLTNLAEKIVQSLDELDISKKKSNIANNQNCLKSFITK